MKHTKLVGTLLGTATVAAGAAIAAAHAKHKKPGKGHVLLEGYEPGKKFSHKKKIKSTKSTAHMNDNKSEHDEIAYETAAVTRLIEKSNAVLVRQQGAEYPKKEIERFENMSGLKTIEVDEAILGNPDVTYQLFRAIRYSNENLQNDLITAFNYKRFDYFNNVMNKKTHAAAVVRNPSFVFEKPTFKSEHSNHKLFRDGWVVVSKLKVVKEDGLKWVWYKTHYGWIPEEAIIISQSAGTQEYVKNAERKIGRSPFAVGNQHNTVEAFSE